MQLRPFFVFAISILSFHSLVPMNRPYAHYPRPHNYYHNDVDAATVGKAALVIGGLAAVGYGLYKFCDWLFSPSNQTLIKNAESAISLAHADDEIISCIEGAFNGIPDGMREQKKLIESVCEPLLYQLALKNAVSVTWNLNNSLSRLRDNHAALAQRITKLRTSPEHTAVMITMQDLDHEIIGLLLKIEFVHEFLIHHRSYFTLFEHEAKILRSYEVELQALTHYAQNPTYVREALRARVMQNASYNRNSYPFMTYIEALQANINTLMAGMNGLAYNYANRIQAAGNLVQNLQIIHSVVIIEDAYHQELRDYKKEQLERQRIEAEKAKAAAAAAQAAALQQQAWQMERQNQLHAQQIRVDAERNAIMAAQTVVHAFNPPQQTHVNVYV
jgi:hypothetical protein